MKAIVANAIFVVSSNIECINYAMPKLEELD
jgi:hypothetical protein